MSWYNLLTLNRRTQQMSTPEQEFDIELYCQSPRCENPLLQKGGKFIMNADGALVHTYCYGDIAEIFFAVENGEPVIYLKCPQPISYRRAQQLAKRGEVKFTHLEQTALREA